MTRKREIVENVTLILDLETPSLGEKQPLIRSELMAFAGRLLGNTPCGEELAAPFILAECSGAIARLPSRGPLHWLLSPVMIIEGNEEPVAPMRGRR